MGGCETEPDFDTCVDCCIAQEPAATDLLDGYFQDACICGAAAPCAMACATECADPMAMLSMECDTCIDNVFDTQDMCVNDYLTACQGDAACAPILACVQTCPQ